MLKSFFLNKYKKEFLDNENNIITLLNFIFNKTKRKNFKILDVGCGDGRLKSDVLECFYNLNFDLYGIEGRKSAVLQAIKKGFKVKIGDLRDPWPFENKMFDIIHGDQIIEHLLNKDNFLEKCKDKLKDNGYLIISTENLSSIDNIFSLMLGFEPFSQHLSMDCYIGNPLSPHYGEKLDDNYENFGHKMICSFLGLKQLLVINGFKVIKVLGAGFFPLPDFFSKLDPRHARFITILAKKSNK